MRSREDGDFLQFFQHFSSEAVDFLNHIDFIERTFDTNDRVSIWREDFDGISERVEHPLFEFQVRSPILNIGQTTQQLVALNGHAALQVDGERFVALDVSKTVNTGDRCNDEHVTAREQVHGCRMAKLFDLFVDARIFLDVRIGVRYVRLRLVVIVVRDEVADRIIGEELLELVTKLGSQRLIVGQNQRRALHLLDNIGHGKGFSRSRGTEQGLMLLAFLQPRHELFDSLRLVASWLIGRFEDKRLLLGHI